MFPENTTQAGRGASRGDPFGIYARSTTHRESVTNPETVVRLWLRLPIGAPSPRPSSPRFRHARLQKLHPPDYQIFRLLPSSLLPLHHVYTYYTRATQSPRRQAKGAQGPISTAGRRRPPPWPHPPTNQNPPSLPARPRLANGHCQAGRLTCLAPDGPRAPSRRGGGVKWRGDFLHGGRRRRRGARVATHDGHEPTRTAAGRPARGRSDTCPRDAPTLRANDSGTRTSKRGPARVFNFFKSQGNLATATWHLHMHGKGAQTS